MAKLVYGAWDGRVIDNRDQRTFEIEDVPALNEFDEFDPANPVRAFFGDRGFAVFDREVSLLRALLCYINRAAEESCGKCTPCRVGTQILRSKPRKRHPSRAQPGQSAPSHEDPAKSRSARGLVCQ